PKRATSVEPVKLTLTGRFPLKAGIAPAAEYGAFLGDIALEQPLVQSDGTLTATAPAGVAAGVYDVRVVDAWRREAALADGYQVLAGAAPPEVAQLAFTSAAQTVVAGRCSQAVTVQAQTSAGAPVV